MRTSPLRSATDSSDPGFIRAVHSERTGIEAHIGSDGAAHMLPKGAGLLVRARYPAFEGSIGNGPHLRIGLCLGTGTRLMQQTGTARLEGIWRPGTLTITPPDCEGFAASGRVAMIGMAILPNAFLLSPAMDADGFHGLASRFHDDALVASVLTALYHEADAHGASTAFFEHGVALVLNRLSVLLGKPVPHRSVRPLSQARYNRLLAHIRGRLGDDLPVAEMAAAAGMDPSGFTRALRALTGVAPYAWLTRYRMEEAARLLARGLPVTQVAGKVGYANAGKFAAAFRRSHGIVPSRWLFDA